MTTWNTKLEEVTQRIGEDAKGYKLMHLSQARQSNTIYNRLILVGIFVGPLGGILSTINQVLGEPHSPVLSISETILGFMSGIIIAVIKFGKYDEATNANQAAAASYTSLEANVRRQLSLYRADRMKATAYMDWLQTKYEETMLAAPLLSSNTHSQYIIHAAREGWTVPNQYDHVITINQDIQPREIIDTSAIILQSNLPSPTTKVPNPSIIVKRTNTMTKIPEMNKYSDKMLQYEMQRMIGNV